MMGILGLGTIFYQAVIAAIIIFAATKGKKLLYLAITIAVIWTLTHVFYPPLMVMQLCNIICSGIYGYRRASQSGYQVGHNQDCMSDFFRRIRDKLFPNRQCPYRYGMERQNTQVYPNARPNNSLKKFEIETSQDGMTTASTSRRNTPQSQQGTFVIHEVRDVHITRGSDEFAIHGQTRPTQCPLCLTEEKITRHSSGRWQCKECGNEW